MLYLFVFIASVATFGHLRSKVIHAFIEDWKLLKLDLFLPYIPIALFHLSLLYLTDWETARH